MIYLDNAATSFPKAPGLAEAMAWHLNNIAGNIGRSSYSSSLINSTFIFETREKLANLLNAEDSSRFIFTNNATQALNTAILGSTNTGDRLLVSPLEHNSVMRPLSFLQKEKKIEIHTFKLSSDFHLDSKDFEKQIVEKRITKVITTLASNVTGSILPFQEISKICQKYAIDLILDASQYIGYQILDLHEVQASAICFPGHKGLLGPSGTGILWINQNFSPKPLSFGGTGSKSDSIIQPNFLPDMFESGTPNIVGIYGLSIALDYILKEGISEIRNKRERIISYFFTKLKEIEELIIYSNSDIERQIGVISFNAKNISASDLTRELDKRDIAIRMGLHCSPTAHKFINTLELGGTLRISPSSFTKIEEIDQVIKDLKEIIYGFKR